MSCTWQKAKKKKKWLVWFLKRLSYFTLKTDLDLLPTLPVAGLPQEHIALPSELISIIKINYECNQRTKLEVQRK